MTPSTLRGGKYSSEICGLPSFRFWPIRSEIFLVQLMVSYAIEGWLAEGIQKQETGEVQSKWAQRRVQYCMVHPAAAVRSSLEFLQVRTYAYQHCT